MSEQAAAAPDKGFFAKAFANRSFVAGFVITALVAGVALLSFFWTPYDVTKLIVADRMQPPSATHIFGTDHFGRDMLSMIMVGARNSIAVALVAVGIGMGIGVPLGCWAAARGGYVDDALMRFNDIVFAFPALLSAIMITAIFGPGAVNAIIAIGIFNIPVFARVARAGALALWPREFILAARAAGKGRALITVEHILPNIANLLLVQGTRTDIRHDSLPGRDDQRARPVVVAVSTPQHAGGVPGSLRLVRSAPEGGDAGRRAAAPAGKEAGRVERREMVAHALHEVGLLPSDMQKYPHEFSGGQRQRISIARAIITRPKLVVADEPVSALDVSIRAQVLDLFAELNQKLGIAYLFITHDLTVARAITDEVMVMHEGRIVETGRTAEVLTHPQSEAAQTLVDAAPDLHRAIAKKMQEQG